MIIFLNKKWNMGLNFNPTEFYVGFYFNRVSVIHYRSKETVYSLYFKIPLLLFYIVLTTNDESKRLV